MIAVYDMYVNAGERGEFILNMNSFTITITIVNRTFKKKKYSMSERTKKALYFLTQKRKQCMNSHYINASLSYDITKLTILKNSTYYEKNVIYLYLVDNGV